MRYHLEAEDPNVEGQDSREIDRTMSCLVIARPRMRQAHSQCGRQFKVRFTSTCLPDTRYPVRCGVGLYAVAAAVRLGSGDRMVSTR